MQPASTMLRPTTAGTRHGVRPNLVVLGLIVWSLMGAVAASAEDVMRVEVQFLDAARGDATEQALLTIAPRKLRIDQFTNLRDKAQHSLIYRGDRDVIYSIDSNDKQYIEVDRALITTLGKELQAARREMEALLRRLPDDQRKSGERIIGLEATNEDGQERAALRVRDEGSTVRRLGRDCRKVTLWRGYIQVAAACVVPWRSVGIGPRDLDVFRQLANFQREIMGAGGLTPLEVVPDQPLDILVQFDGFPMEFSRRVKGKLVSAIRVTKMAKSKARAGTFEVPANYAVRPGFEFLAADPTGAPTAPASPAPASPANP